MVAVAHEGACFGDDGLARSQTLADFNPSAIADTGGDGLFAHDALLNHHNGGDAIAVADSGNRNRSGLGFAHQNRGFGKHACADLGGV